jgi:hypothetical protein
MLSSSFSSLGFSKDFRSVRWIFLLLIWVSCDFNCF